MSWNDIRNRLKSPVVVVQILIIVLNVAVAFNPTIEASAKIVVAAINAVYSVFAGLNNPSDREGF